MFPGSTAPRALANFCDANVDARYITAVAAKCGVCGNIHKQTVREREREREQPRHIPLFGQSVDLSDLELCHKLTERRHYCQRQHHHQQQQQLGFVARLGYYCTVKNIQQRTSL